MLSLPQVLYEAQRHSVDEIAIERGEPVTFHGEQGALILGDPLGDSDISDALSQVLAPEQQAELAVAGMVEFEVEGYSEWSLVAETAEEGVVIRGRIRDGKAQQEVGAPLDLPPLQPFEPDRGADIPQSSGSVLQSNSRSTRWDVGLAGTVLDQASVSEPDNANTDSTPKSKNTTIGYGEEITLLPPIQNESFGDADFELVARTGPTGDMPAVESGSLGDLPITVAPSTDGPSTDVLSIDVPSTDGPSTDVLSIDVPSTVVPSTVDGEEPSPMEDPAMGVTLPRVKAIGDDSRSDHEGDTLAAQKDAIGPSTVVYLAGLGVAEQLLERFDEGFETIDDDTWTTVTTLPFEELVVGRAYLVRMEDPSRCVSWLLRRLEEGARVVVEGRARTAAGARRIFIGAEGTPLLVEWLDAHVQLWLYPDGAAWRLKQL